ncbi:MAG: hypothetical protein V4750_12045 [Pseudomonadota bacterium]
MDATTMRQELLFNRYSADAPYASNEKYQAHLLEQYKLYVEMADRHSARRLSANSYFLSVNAAILAFVGYVNRNAAGDDLWLLALAGTTLCALWYRLIRSYRDLNGAKFKVVQQIETQLPISPYAAEWQALGRRDARTRGKHLSVSRIEVGVPWVFAVLHLVVLAKTVPWPALAALF